jgi:hypothetical protein
MIKRGQIYDWTLPKNQKPVIFGGGWLARRWPNTLVLSDFEKNDSSSLSIVSMIEGAPLAMTTDTDENIHGCEPLLLKSYSRWKKLPMWKNRSAMIIFSLRQYIIADIVQIILEYSCNDGFVATTTNLQTPGSDFGLCRTILGRGRFELLQVYHTNHICWVFNILDYWRTHTHNMYSSFASKQHYLFVYSLAINVVLIGDAGLDLSSPSMFIIDSRGSHIQIYSVPGPSNMIDRQSVHCKYDGQYVLVRHEKGQTAFRISDDITDATSSKTTIY